MNHGAVAWETLCYRPDASELLEELSVASGTAGKGVGAGAASAAAAAGSSAPPKSKAPSAAGSSAPPPQPGSKNQPDDLTKQQRGADPKPPAANPTMERVVRVISRHCGPAKANFLRDRAEELLRSFAPSSSFPGGETRVEGRPTISVVRAQRWECGGRGGRQEIISCCCKSDSTEPEFFSSVF